MTARDTWEEAIAIAGALLACLTVIAICFSAPI